MDKETKLSGIMYNHFFSLHNTGVHASPWVTQVKQILRLISGSHKSVTTPAGGN